MTHTILATDPFLDPLLPVLEEVFEVIPLWRHKDPEGLIKERAEEITGLSSSLLPVRRPIIEALPNLEIIANCAVGYDNIDIEACRERGIVITNTPDVLTDDTADVAFLLILNVMRRAVEGDAYVRAGLWPRRGSFPVGRCLSGKTLGIIGLGRIGQAIARRAETFGFNIVYHGPREKSDYAYTYYPKLEKMAKDSDVLVAICPGGEETIGLVNHKIFKALGPEGFFINAARGSVVVEEDLLIALENREIAGAGLDVYANEPHVPEALLSMDNVVLTPHIGSATVETRRKMIEIVRDNLQAYFSGQPLLTPVEI